ncbi:response regulator transcription factor [Methylomicrobium sp. RS1]|uniref:response regulator transcription factor n=1 Tax=Candidatus Methylomicrobium oryzae TaxID=2802053 RepID=UPI001923E0EA|nr:response regulator [Methylomicrobium sp. RS1]MBL1264020.1 response regulator transcription factor [Methylomicrobium sp. RS1]
MSIPPCVFIVDDEYPVRHSLGLMMETAGYAYRTFGSAEDFLQNYRPGQPGCLLLDVNLPGLNGDELQTELIRRKIRLPIIFLTAYGDIPMTVRAIKAGAVDFLTKPVPRELLLERIRTVLEHEAQVNEQAAEHAQSMSQQYGLTSREMEIMALIVEGRPNKEIARQLGISYRTVEIHRARILKKTGTTNPLELARLCESVRSSPLPDS